MNDVRKKKVESLIQGILSQMILTQEIKDPRVSSFLSVSLVKVSNDLSQAKVYISSFQKETTVEKAVEALNHGSGFIQGLLMKRLSMRTVPRVLFFADDSIQKSMELNRMIDEANRS
jgi:ribosome-binding factor A